MMPAVLSLPPDWPCWTGAEVDSFMHLPLPAGPSHSRMCSCSSGLRRLGWGKSLRAHMMGGRECEADGWRRGSGDVSCWWCD